MCINHARCQASTGSIAFDVRDNLMLVFARWFYTNLQHNAALPPTGIYEHLLGIVRINPGPQSSAQAVRHIIEMACTRRKGRRNKDSFHGAEDVLDKDLLEHVKSSITSAVADGGPSEQSALAALPALDLPNVNMISRDRCHRSRGLMKAIWQPLNEMCCGLLGIFITDDKSISRMLRKLGLHVCLKNCRLLGPVGKAYAIVKQWARNGIQNSVLKITCSGTPASTAACSRMRKWKRTIWAFGKLFATSPSPAKGSTA